MVPIVPPSCDILQGGGKPKQHSFSIHPLCIRTCCIHRRHHSCRCHLRRQSPSGKSHGRRRPRIVVGLQSRRGLGSRRHILGDYPSLTPHQEGCENNKARTRQLHRSSSGRVAVLERLSPNLPHGRILQSATRKCLGLRWLSRSSLSVLTT